MVEGTHKASQAGGVRGAAICSRFWIEAWWERPIGGVEMGVGRSTVERLRPFRMRLVPLCAWSLITILGIAESTGTMRQLAMFALGFLTAQLVLILMGQMRPPRWQR
jgi:hypothetical protein